MNPTPINQIFNESCLDTFKRIQPESIDLLLTDPPYKTTKFGKSYLSGTLNSKLAKQGKMFLNNNINIQDWLPPIIPLLKPKAHIYIMCNNLNLPSYLNFISSFNNDIHIFKTLIWDKHISIPNQYYFDSHEYIIFARKGNAKKINSKFQKSILSFPKPNSNQHPTQKPIKLFQQLILNSSSPNQLVLDPFMGAGTTALAALSSNRLFIGSEIDNNFFLTAQSNIANLNSLNFI